MKVLTILGFLVSSVAAEYPSPSAWWSGSSILAGNKKYVTESVSTEQLVGAFSKNSPLLLSREEHVAPEVVLLVVCDKLKNDDFMTYGAMKSLEHVIARSKSSVLIPQTTSGEHTASKVLAASASLYLDDVSDRDSRTYFIDGTDDQLERHFSSAKEFSLASRAIFSNGETEFVVVSLPPESADKAVEELDTLLSKFTSGNYLAGVISESHQTGMDDTEEGAPAARKLLAVPFIIPAAIPITANTLRITPAIILGLMLSFVMFIFLYVGFCGMMDLGVNDQFWDQDKADRGRPLMGRVDE